MFQSDWNRCARLGASLHFRVWVRSVHRAPFGRRWEITFEKQQQLNSVGPTTKNECDDGDNILKFYLNVSTSSQLATWWNSTEFCSVFLSCTKLNTRNNWMEMKSSSMLWWVLLHFSLIGWAIVVGVVCGRSVRKYQHIEHLLIDSESFCFGENMPEFVSLNLWTAAPQSKWIDSTSSATVFCFVSRPSFNTLVSVACANAIWNCLVGGNAAHSNINRKLNEIRCLIRSTYRMPYRRTVHHHKLSQLTMFLQWNPTERIRWIKCTHTPYYRNGFGKNI